MIRLLAVVEAATVTGPAKNLLEFCRIARAPEEGMGVDLSFVTFHRPDGTEKPGEPENEFVATARAQGVDITVLPERGRFDRQVVELLRAVVREKNPDILQTHHVKSHAVMRASGLWKTRPWVAWHHAYTTTDFKMRAYNHMDRWSLRAAHLVMTVNAPFVRDLERIGVAPQRLRALHNAARIGWNSKVSAAQIVELKEELGIQCGERVILAVGRFSLEKAHIDLIHAFALLKKAQPLLKIKLVLVGEGPERPVCENAAARLGIANDVIFAGQRRDVGPFFKMADAMALPSHGEGSPNVLLEAIAAGLPIVSTTVGGIPEMVRHDESALLIEPRDVSGLAREMGRVLNDKSLAQTLAKNGLIVAQKYTPEVRLAALLDVYRGLAPQKVAEREVVKTA